MSELKVVEDFGIVIYVIFLSYSDYKGFLVNEEREILKVSGRKESLDWKKFKELFRVV